MFPIRITLCLVCFVILCNLSVNESRRVSGGGRRTTWSRPSSTSIAKPKPQPTYSHSDITKLTYGHNEQVGARRPASPPKNTHTGTGGHKPSAPPAETHVQRPNTNTNPNSNNPNPNNPNPNNIGWNVPQNNPGGTGTQNVGWNTNNQQHTQQRVNTANAPPPYPGGAPHPQGPPPPYPGLPSPGQNFGAPPAYPGHVNHGAPPAYSGYPSHGPPPPYQAVNPGYHGTNYNPNQAKYPQQPGYGGVGGYQGYPQQNQGGFGGGYGGAPGGYGGYGGGGYGGGGFGGGGFGGGGFGGGGFGGGGLGGYGGYGGNGMFAQRKSGISGTTIVGGALLGLTLYSLTRDRNHYHYYYPNSQPVNQNGQPITQNGQPVNVQGQPQGNAPGNANVPNGEHSFSGDQGAYTSYIGNLSCISIYNAREVSLWANNTLNEFYAQYPTQAFPVSMNGSNQSMNFTIVPGEIIHNETLAITCCGTDKGPIDVLMITNGKSRDVNCIYETYTMPFRRLTFIPTNNTANATNSTTPIAAPLTSTALAGNTSTTMAGITSTMAETTPTPLAGSTTVVPTTNATTTTTVAAATTQEAAAETTTPTTTTTAAVQNLTTSENIKEEPTTTPSAEITTIKN